MLESPTHHIPQAYLQTMLPSLPHGFLVGMLFSMVALLATPAAPRCHAQATSKGAVVVIERFPCATGGDAIILPVRVDDKIYDFLFDTGCEVTAVDTSLLTSEPIRQARFNTPNQFVKMSLYPAPSMSLGRLDVKVPRVVGVDLSDVRSAAKFPVYGVLGVDFLRSHVVQINKDQGELLFLKSADASLGTRVNLSLASGIPTTAIEINGQRVTRAKIDTGMVKVESGAVSSRFFESALAKSTAEFVGMRKSATIAAQYESKVARFNTLKIGNHVINSPLLIADDDDFSIGLGLLARFIVTFDFPRARMYLEPGQAFAARDRFTHYGLEIDRITNRTYAAYVRDNSAAAKAGFKVGDVVLQVNGHNANDLSLLEIRAMLVPPHEEVRFVFDRNGDRGTAILKAD